ncbi:MAG: 4'-phosphopantetheinyl transferase superfamily protein [Armatimonadetes bacterium]|nr:4'-phosphopantetheinyl transferase superfamily protein [Armatimonadota bacterium]NIM22855.1 4'-phosphopantetheinyl transferase superfamily protein [Armatimonadota bacterium]NIM66721.1 4'-phosphopantetheinyl transferase superfamily protein [Armatimonadota bacterium]NIM75278.1 4'-phosphopantetheinyl transferase superfamily protein [Armatimonadota bacterium]NIN04918.1 4'-phosphopantetheinyl transferase superfamily protein [Armatimonadota bacterium]
MAQALERWPRLRERLFTAAERRYCEARQNPAQHYAVRFAAKEAIVKALGRSLSWQDVEISRAGAGPPRAVLHGKAQDAAGGGKTEISLSHSGEYAVACAVFWPDMGRDVES